MFVAVYVVTSLLLLAYCILVLQYRKWFLQLPVFKPAEVTADDIFFSVIIPARNEESNIEKCLRSVLSQDFPAERMEVIVINDHSTDGTEEIVKRLQREYAQLRLLDLAQWVDKNQLNSYKKKAIETAVAQSRGNWIVTTDADCTVGPRWLSLYASYISRTGKVFVAAPVMFSNDHSFLSLFQSLDFMSLQGITAAAVSAGHHTMCNGANIAYSRQAFYDVGRFSGIDHLASGDDMLLMYKMKKAFKDGLGYLHHPSAIVVTEPMRTWKDFLNQRIRWASKADQYKDRSIFWTLLLVYLVNALLLVILFLGIWVKGGILAWLVLLGVKILAELALMLPVARFYRQENTLVWFALMQPFHIAYTVAAGWLGKFGSYRWKGRAVK